MGTCWCVGFEEGRVTFPHRPESCAFSMQYYRRHIRTQRAVFNIDSFRLYSKHGNWVKLLTDRLSTHSWTFDGWAAVSAELRQRVERS